MSAKSFLIRIIKDFGLLVLFGAMWLALPLFVKIESLIDPNSPSFLAANIYILVMVIIFGGLVFQSVLLAFHRISNFVDFFDKNIFPKFVLKVPFPRVTGLIIGLLGIFVGASLVSTFPVEFKIFGFVLATAMLAIGAATFHQVPVSKLR